MKEKFLPIGTVVLLSGATKRLMITGYCAAQAENQNVVFDYVGCLFPEGNLMGDDVALFNHSQIGSIVYMGLDDDEFKSLNKSINEALAEESTEKSGVSGDFMSQMPSLTPENLSNIVNQIKSQNNLDKPVVELTPFSEEVIKKPNFAMPTLGVDSSNKTKKENTTEKKTVDFAFEEEAIPVEEKVYDGQPVLQLQPIFNEGSAPSTPPNTSTNPSVIGLERL